MDKKWKGLEEGRKRGRGRDMRLDFIYISTIRTRRGRRGRKTRTRRTRT